MSSVENTDQVDELERRIEALELLIHTGYWKKVEQGLRDEHEGNTMSLQEYEDSLEDQDLVRQFQESEEDVETGRTTAWSAISERG